MLNLGLGDVIEWGCNDTVKDYPLGGGGGGFLVENFTICFVLIQHLYKMATTTDTFKKCIKLLLVVI